MLRDEALKILGIRKEEPTEREIRKRFLQLSLTKHPDKGGNPEEFHKIHKAYQVLIGEELESDETASGMGGGGMDGRGIFERMFSGRGGSGGGMSGMGGFGGIPGMAGMGGGAGMNHMFQSVFGGFNEMFSNFQNAAPKEPIQKTIKLTVGEIFKGATRDISIDILEKCTECLGTGTGSKVKCSDCDGNGIRVAQTRSGNTVHIQRVGCTTCGGRGGIGVGAERPCGACMGRRQKVSVVSKTINIPRAIPDNTRITINEGDRPTILLIRHPPPTDPEWKGWELTSTRDLKYPLTITLEEALLGGNKEITLPNEGVLSFAIPPGVQPGNTLRIADKGLPACPDAKLPPSSVLVQINVTLPKIPDNHREHTRKFFSLISATK